MSRKLLLSIGTLVLLLLVGVWGVSGQGGEEFEEVLIFTTATDVVGVGTYVAAEAYGIAAGENPDEQPAQAVILPYGIYPNMHVAVIEDFVQPEPAVEGFEFAWSLSAPSGSAAELIEGTVAIFMADVEGEYVLTLTVTDEGGNVGETSWVVNATTYVGNGYLEDNPEAPQCLACHDDTGAGWAATRHANTTVDTFNGALSDHFGPDCLYCHVTGFNNRPEAVNGGFDDLALDAGWSFPEELAEGGWDAFVEEFPEVAELANVQCEACHGPGSLHQAAAAGGDDEDEDEGGGGVTMAGPIGRGLDYGTCAQCHAEEPYLTIPLQWENSAHSDKNAQAFWYPIGEDHASCVRCHSGEGYIDWANGVESDEMRTGYQTITCAVCHDPHDASNPNQLRVFDSVTLPDGTEVADAGPAATCMSCHNSRRDPTTTVQGAVAGDSFSTPHYSTAGELMNTVGGYTWGMDLPTSPHGRIIEDTCIGCHMGASPGMDADGAPLPGHNEVGEHTFAMVSASGVQNVGICQTCHDRAESFNFEAFRDYDGDGTIETNDEEVEGLRALLEEALVEAGVEVLDHHPYFTIPENSSEDIYGAVWNLAFTESGGSSVHNLRYTVALLQLSYEMLTGEAVPGAYILGPKM